MVVAACGSGDPDPQPPTADPCDGTTPALVLAPGAYRIIDPALTAGCVALPAAAAGTEYLVALVSGSGLQTQNGVSGLAVLATPAVGAPTPAIRREAVHDAGRVAAFHAALRGAEERAAAAGQRAMVGQGVSRLMDPPVPGTARTFSTCAAPQCDVFTDVTATARWVGRHAAIYLDDTVPQDGLTEGDIADLGQLFDDHLYDIATTAFGAEPDLDGNGVIIVLLTDAVNGLSGACADGSVIQGYFSGMDLVPGAGSNGGEIIYGRVPDPSVPACNHTRARVTRTLPAVLVHEFQHLISFNQKVLVQGGAPEHRWLNEGLSHFAEELASRLVPGSASRFIEGNVYNAFDYLSAPGAGYLVTPASSSGSPAERGAQWLFLRWLTDRVAREPVPGTAVTRALLESPARGADAVAGVAQRPFEDLIGAWQLANALDDLPGFNGHPDLAYASLDLRGTMRQLGPVFPLRPDSTGSRGYQRAVTLRAGSGQHVRLVLGPGESAGLLATSSTGGALDPLLMSRVAIARVR